MIKNNILCLVFFFTINSLLACSCSNNLEGLILDYLSTDVVFEGKVLKVKLQKSYKKVVFKISKLEKGIFLRKRIIFYIDNSCPFDLKKNEKWLIGVDKENELYQTDMCYTNYKINSFAHLYFRDTICRYFLKKIYHFVINTFSN